MRTAGGRARGKRGRMALAAALSLIVLLGAACAAPKARPAPRPRPLSDGQREAVDVLYRQGVELYLAGDLKGAVRTWRLVLQKDPRHLDAKRSLDRAETELEALRKRGKT